VSESALDPSPSVWFQPLAAATYQFEIDMGGIGLTTAQCLYINMALSEILAGLGFHSRSGKLNRIEGNSAQRLNVSGPLYS